MFWISKLKLSVNIFGMIAAFSKEFGAFELRALLKIYLTLLSVVSNLSVNYSSR